MRTRIKSKGVVASSRVIRVGWVRLHKGAFPKIKMVFDYNGKGVNMARL